MIQLKRCYDAPSQTDGLRILVDRLWPRGVSKVKAAIDLWLKEVAPSTDLRKWFDHEPAKWESFVEKYFAELEQKGDLILLLKHRCNEGPVTFVYAARDDRYNHALALNQFLEHCC